MSLGERIQMARKAADLTQSQLAEQVGVSFQAISSWERDEYLPDTGNLLKTAEVLGISAAALLDKENKSVHVFRLRDRMFSEEHMYTFVKSAAASKALVNTMKALPYMRQAHHGQYRKSNDGHKVPYISHPLMMACHALALGIDEDSILAAILLHDVLEDCGGTVNDLPVDEITRRTVMVVTKTKAEKEPPGVSRVSNGMLDHYYGGISKNRDAMLVKILDRCNNLSSMATGFTSKRMGEYIEETEYYILPMLEQLSHKYPEFYEASFLIKYHMLSVMETVKRTLR